MNSTRQQIESFRSFALEQVELAGIDLPMDELYERWRQANLPDERALEDELAIRAALRDMQNGDTGQDYREFLAEFRARHGITEAK